MAFAPLQQWLIGLNAAPYISILLTLCRVLVPILAILLLVRCIKSLLSGRTEREQWGKLTLPNGDFGVFHHWENTVGRSRRCDVVLHSPTVSRSHAAFLRNQDGQWRVYNLAKNELTVNGVDVCCGDNAFLQNGDVISLGGVSVTFSAISAREALAQAKRRTRPGKTISPGFSLLVLTLIQLLLCGELLLAYPENCNQILISFCGLSLIMWGVYCLCRILRRTAFELETLAFFLTTLCMTVTANKAPGELYKQLLCVILGLVVFFAISFVLRDLTLAKKLRWPVVLMAVALLGFNLLFGTKLFGAKNWMVLGPISFQPSELVKLAFILGGATTLDRMFSRRNLIFTLLFSAFCVGCLGLMSDFGTALIFFATFLAIAFLRSGDLPSVAFMSAAAIFGGYIILNFKPYIARRFSIYLNVWSDTANLGYQQTRTMSAIAGGGLFGNGLGNGWLKNIGAANTDLVFGVVSDELGLLVALSAVAVIVVMALFAVKSAATARSTFYVIAACSTALLLVVQTMLNVFGSIDLLPLTGVTFPFLSMGGSSMICCWGLLAYIKASDTRQNAALAVRLPSRKAAKAEEQAAQEQSALADYLKQAFDEDEDDFTIPLPDDSHYDADNWQQYFYQEEDKQ